MVAGPLADLLVAGVGLDFSRDPDRPTFRVLRTQRPLVEALLTPEAKPQTQHVLALVAAYRRVLRNLFAANARGPEADPSAVRAQVQEEMRLHDDLGPRLADLVFERIADEYERGTGLCAMCGEPGGRRQHRVSGGRW